MPVFEYEPADVSASCDYCVKGFDALRKLSEGHLTQCPRCGAAIRRRYSVPSVGHSRTSLHRRAKEAGFHKLEKRGKGEYEKVF